MMIYLRNAVGFKMNYFKGMTYDDIRPIFKKKFNSNVAFLQKTKEHREEENSRALKRLSETQEEKAAKKQKLDEEVSELKRHLQIVPNDKDDVYTEATPLARKRIGYALSSVEGRVAMEFFDLSEAGQSKNYIFKCHTKSEGERDIVYPVNTIAFHPTRHNSKEQSRRAKRGNGIPPAIVPAGTSEEKPVPVVA
nr:hypothetical protein [Tanacetum cinerariifolium]